MPVKTKKFILEKDAFERLEGFQNGIGQRIINCLKAIAQELPVNANDEVIIGREIVEEAITLALKEGIDQPKENPEKTSE